MAVHLESTQVIDRPVDKVFLFFAVEHVRNHPRWDPDIELWLDTEAPIGLGTVIHRRNKRSGTTVEGTMEVVEFEPDHSFGMVIYDGPAVTHGRTTFKALDGDHTRLTTTIDIPWMDETADTSFLERRLAEAGQIRKQLMEAEL
jgi:hypothetical protein